MDINFGNIGINTGHNGVNGVGGDRAVGKASAPATTANLTIGEHVARIASGEPVAAVPEAALTRDDKLGALVAAAFNLPPPQMPDFA